MRFGVFVLGDKPAHLSHQEVFENVLEEARWAEELGYDEVWLAEHHFSPYGTLANLPLVAAAIAAQTERIRIGTACMVAPFHDPIHLAEQIAMVDNLSGGRFDAGFGRGYQAHEFRGFGVSMDEATARYQECLTIVQGLLTQENFSYDGQFWQIDDLTIQPRPVQDPMPIWCTVMKTPSSFAWMADRGYGAIIGNPYQVDPDLQAGPTSTSSRGRAAAHGVRRLVQHDLREHRALRDRPPPRGLRLRRAAVLEGHPSRGALGDWAEIVADAVIAGEQIAPNLEDGVRCQEVLAALRASSAAGSVDQGRRRMTSPKSGETAWGSRWRWWPRDSASPKVR
jgi:alkanesulfonate monooxygenase SsuD/methylene tetrahydromethanopterin reductase-like flavin-dependent oxidoreductase (luciferase family)